LRSGPSACQKPAEFGVYLSAGPGGTFDSGVGPVSGPPNRVGATAWLYPGNVVVPG
jgi:hypothetical protein